MRVWCAYGGTDHGQVRRGRAWRQEVSRPEADLERPCNGRLVSRSGLSAPRKGPRTRQRSLLFRGWLLPAAVCGAKRWGGGRGTEEREVTKEEERQRGEGHWHHGSCAVRRGCQPECNRDGACSETASLHLWRVQDSACVAADKADSEVHSSSCTGAECQWPTGGPGLARADSAFGCGSR
eukprot:628787-Rhodomonas_salina.1